jgi:hypothetical protein
MKKAANRPEVREKQAEHACSGCGEKSKDGSGIDTHHVYPLNDWIDKGHDPSDYPDCWFMTLDKRMNRILLYLHWTNCCTSTAS